MDLSKDQVGAIVSWARRTSEIRAAILFGSRAKGTSGPESDVDLALVIDDLNPLAVFVMKGELWQNDLRQMTGLPVNIEFLGPESTKIRSYLEECSIELFRR
jgi:predicted nucleotidyltransferase